MNPPLPYDDFFVKYGGESQDGVSERMAKTLSQVMEQEDHHFVLAVSHGIARRCHDLLLALLQAAFAARDEKLHHPQTQI